MKALQKKIVSVVLVGALLIAVAVSVSKEGGKHSVLSVKHTADTQEDDAYQKAVTDVVFWYNDPTYTDFFDQATERYFTATGVKVAAEYQETIDYIGTVYDKTMQDDEGPDAYLISGEYLEEAYLYGLACVNEQMDSYQNAAKNAVQAATYDGKLLGYPLSYNTCVFVYQNGYFAQAPQSIQAIIDYSNENEPAENVEYLLEWNVNDAFYDFPFVANSVTFEKTKPQQMSVVYNEDLYNQDLTFFETILNSFSVDADKVSEERIIENFLAGRTLCAILDSDSLARLDGYQYSMMQIPSLSEELSSATSATTDMIAVNEFSKQSKKAVDFAKYVTTDMAEELRPTSGHYSVFQSENADAIEKIVYDTYENAVLAPNSMDAKDFWVGLKETISQYF